MHVLRAFQLGLLDVRQGRGASMRSVRAMSKSRLLCITLLLVTGVQAGTSAQTGREITQKERDLHRSRDEQEISLMRLVNKAGETKERRMVSYVLMDSENLAKTLIRFLAPRDIENTGLLTWEAKNGDDDQWLYLPATRKPKRIPSSGKKNRFMGTDFAFEDLRPENLALHTHTLIGSETVDGKDCYVIEAVPATERQAGDSGYGKRKSWIRKDIHLTVKREYYDKKGKLEKVETRRNLVNVKGGMWRANEVEMHDVRIGSRTIVVTQSRSLDQGLNTSFFTEANLTRGGV